jgi:TRAP-type C4-dicarboxylate transport system substrate-binding protein
VAALSGSPASAQITLRLNHQLSAVAAGAQVDQWYADEVAKRTNGKVVIKMFYSEALGKAKEMLSLVKQGAVDIAAVSPSFFPSELPFFSAPNSIPMAMDSTLQAQVIMHTLLDRVPAFMDEAKANNVRPIFFHVLNPYYLLCKHGVRQVDDLKGKKIRTWGEDMPRLMQAAGAVPVTLFIPELYESLQRGVIDCTPMSVDLAVSYKLHEVAKNLAQVVTWQGPTHALWVNLDKWNSIPPDAQKIMLEVAEEAKKKDLEKLAEADKAARDAMKAGGVTLTDFPEAERQKWVAASPDFFADWVAKMDKLGKGEAARQTVAMWKEIRAKTR